jgi:hypothetical protein
MSSSVISGTGFFGIEVLTFFLAGLSIISGLSIF